MAHSEHVRSRPEMAADRLAAIARDARPGARLGTKEELRASCGVSVGTFNEALRLAQARGLVSVRPGPGGGLFAAEQSPMVRLGNAVLALDGDRTPAADAVSDAVRIRDALDPLLVEDALWHASPADIADMRGLLAEMARAMEVTDATAFTRANWRLHARIAETSPSPVLRSIYTGLLDLIESNTRAVLFDERQAVPEYLAERLRLHRAIVDAIEDRDRERAQRLIQQHNTTGEPDRG
ncbi:FCD domain-containing protein [Spongiactinospora sp. TRM90649]|uniref:FadR/GntR family transcriptional regulator n=1 Tax=Spongiactinospora sp. TRM90649 TaxID=3031114 RepID=UPI0023FA2200|nr:FCD domain-containing protein [Spongiactinospora sp. TRM90649]MDF5752920.1 FCD domain-containing protein [Spongiactinospora sp. TRM90649]